MKAIFAGVLAVHGVIHILGVARAFGWADLPQLTQPIPRVAGLGWLLAALAFVSAALALFLWPRWWWLPGLCGVSLSICLLVLNWPDARLAIVPNAIVLAGSLFGFLAGGPYSLRAAYDFDAARLLAPLSPPPLIRESDVAHLPAPVQRYLH